MIRNLTLSTLLGLLTNTVDSSYGQELKMAEVNNIGTYSWDYIAVLTFIESFYNVPLGSSTVQCTYTVTVWTLLSFEMQGQSTFSQVYSL